MKFKFSCQNKEKLAQSTITFLTSNYFQKFYYSLVKHKLTDKTRLFNSCNLHYF